MLCLQAPLSTRQEMKKKAKKHFSILKKIKKGMIVHAQPCDSHHGCSKLAFQSVNGGFFAWLKKIMMHNLHCTCITYQNVFIHVKNEPIFNIFNHNSAIQS